MVELTFPCTIYSLISPIYLFYHILVNYVVHSKLKVNLHHKNPHILLDLPSKLGFDEFLRFRMFEVSWGSAVTPAPYTYPNLLNKKASTPFERKYHIVCTTFLIFLLMQVRTSHGGWCRYSFESFSYTSRTGRAWRSIVRRDCFSMAARRRTAQASGAHSSRSFSMGSSTIS